MPWRSWLERRLLVTGVLLVVAAVVAFFAWNWDRLSAPWRFGLVEGGFVLSTAAAVVGRLRRARTLADAARTAACFLIGVFWAVFGQIYQTGADSWQLFALWAACILPWFAAGPSLSLWALWLAVANLAAWLWSVQEGRSLPDAILPPLLLSLGAWLACLGVVRRASAVRVAALFLVPWLTAHVCLQLLDRAADFGPLGAGALLLVLVFVAAVRTRDRFTLALLALGGFPLLNTALARLIAKHLFSAPDSILVLPFAVGNIAYTALLLRVFPALPGGLRFLSAGKIPFADKGETGTVRRLLAGAGGVFSGLALLILFATTMLDIGNSEALLLPAGLAALAVSAVLCRRRTDAFARMFGFSLSLAGLALALAGLAFRESLPVSLTTNQRVYGCGLLLALGVYGAVPHKGTRFAAAVVAWLLAVRGGLLLLEDAGRPFSLLFARAALGLCALPLAARVLGRRLPDRFAPAAAAGLLLLFLTQFLQAERALEGSLPSLIPWAAAQPAFPTWLIALLLLPAWGQMTRPALPLPLLTAGGALLFVCLAPKEAAAVLLCLLIIRQGRKEWNLQQAAAAAGGLAVVLWLCPAGVLFAFCLLGLGHAENRRRTTLAGWIWLAVFVTVWYMRVDLPFAWKSLAMGGAGAALLAGAGILRFRNRRAAHAAGAPSCSEAPASLPRLGALCRSLAPLLLPALLTLAGFHLAAADKERLLATGDELLLALAPVDPRSLLQGDYMALEFRLEGEIRRRLAQEPAPSARHGLAVLRRAADHTAELTALRFDGKPVAPGEYAVRFSLPEGRLRLAHSFLFEEGLADLYSAARYGIFRCTPQGECLLTGLADGQGRPLRKPERQD